MGWCVMDYDPAHQTYVVIKTGTLNGHKLIKFEKDIKDHFSKSFCILSAYLKSCRDLITTYKPQYVVSEGAFHSKFPQTLIALTLIIHTIRTACRDVTGRDIFVVAPMETKKEVANHHMADKELIKKSVLKFPSLRFSSELVPDDMSEHEFDAVAHGICFIRRCLPNVLK